MLEIVLLLKSLSALNSEISVFGTLHCEELFSEAVLQAVCGYPKLSGC